MKYISLSPTTTAFIVIPGYMMDKTSDIYLRLSGSTIYSSNTSISTLSAFTTNPLVSALLPSITAIKYPNFSIIDNNHLKVNLYGLSGNGYIDIITYNQAGYTKLSDHNFLVKIAS